ncbi:MAG: hypothetical protein K2Q06_03205, partial [Parvularculaceae bacterium]|nr:hypothetical protein [Parvularculaceae bacterium]
DGEGGFDLADGALKGVNLVKLARAVDQIRKGGVNPAALTQAVAAAQSPNERTDYSQFLSAFVINDGQMRTSNIALKGPFITMTGAGLVNLPGQKMDIRLAPRASTTADGQGGYTLAIPLKVGGTFAKPTLGVDLETLLRGRIEKGVGDFLGGIFGGKKEGSAPGGGTKSPIEDILGGPGAAPSDDAAKPEPSPEKAIAKDVVDSIFGRKKTEDAAEPAPQPQ